MWAENLVSANKQFKLHDEVKIRRYGNYCLIDDERIPKDWYYNKLCFTGCLSPSLEVLRDMYQYLGDPGNELQRYEDPKTYWTSRGHEYIEGPNGFTTIKYNLSTQSRKLDPKYTLCWDTRSG